MDMDRARVESVLVPVDVLTDMVAHLMAAASAYEKHASRSRSVGRATPDAFFTTRVKDFASAAARAEASLRDAVKANKAQDALPARCAAALRTLRELTDEGNQLEFFIGFVVAERGRYLANDALDNSLPLCLYFSDKEGREDFVRNVAEIKGWKLP